MSSKRGLPGLLLDIDDTTLVGVTLVGVGDSES